MLKLDCKDNIEVFLSKNKFSIKSKNNSSTFKDFKSCNFIDNVNIGYLGDLFFTKCSLKQVKINFSECSKEEIRNKFTYEFENCQFNGNVEIVLGQNISFSLKFIGLIKKSYAKRLYFKIKC